MKISKRQLQKLIREQTYTQAMKDDGDWYDPDEDDEYTDEDYANDPEYAENEDTPPITNEDLREVVYELFLQGEGTVTVTDIFDYYRSGGYDNDAIDEAIDFAFVAG